MVVKPPDPDRFLRWGGHEHCLDLDAHTEIGTSVLKHAVQNGGEKAFSARLRELLASTFRRGHALGKAEAEHALREIVGERVKKAIEGIAIEPAKCPHCAGLGCDECGRTGRFRESMRLR